MLSGDHFFHTLKCNFTFNRRKLFMAAYSLIYEHTEVTSIMSTERKTLEELRCILESVQARTVALGLPPLQVQAFFTDKPTAEALFLESEYPKLKRTTVFGTNPSAYGAATSAETPELPRLVIPTDHTVSCATSAV